ELQGSPAAVEVLAAPASGQPLQRLVIDPVPESTVTMTITKPKGRPSTVHGTVTRMGRAVAADLAPTAWKLPDLYPYRERLQPDGQSFEIEGLYAGRYEITLQKPGGGNERLALVDIDESGGSIDLGAIDLPPPGKLELRDAWPQPTDHSIDVVQLYEFGTGRRGSVSMASGLQAGVEPLTVPAGTYGVIMRDAGGDVLSSMRVAVAPGLRTTVSCKAILPARPLTEVQSSSPIAAGTAVEVHAWEPDGVASERDSQVATATVRTSSEGRSFVTFDADGGRTWALKFADQPMERAFVLPASAVEGGAVATWSYQGALNR
ncbi:MAG: hypothetical protein AAGG01_24355, partial [Planctomycetota bacterium]